MSVEQSVLTVVMDNPARRNALDDASVAAFIGAVEAAQNA